MPQYKNALAAPYVRRFCEKWSVPADDATADAMADRLKYTEHSYMTAWRLMLSNLNQVGKHYYENEIAEQASMASALKPKDD